MVLEVSFCKTLSNPILFLPNLTLFLSYPILSLPWSTDLSKDFWLSLDKLYNDFFSAIFNKVHLGALKGSA